MEPLSDMEFLLGRRECVPDLSPAADVLSEKTVLVTGAGGSIGSALCRRLLKLPVQKVVALDISENSLCALCRAPGIDLSRLSVETADITEPDELRRILSRSRPETVFHAAAHKHVHLMEVSPHRAVKNNVLGTANVLACAKESKVEQFILISTDKAIRPTGVMGQTKRLCEKLTCCENGADMRCSAVRFGNVLASSGSAAELFALQIERGGPVTVTDRRATRYFMTVAEASALVLRAAAEAQGGEIFSLAMGKPLFIDTLARRMIEASGRDMPIVYTGLRPGERLREEPLVAECVPCGTIVSSPDTPFSKANADAMLASLKSAVYEGDLRRSLAEWALM